VVWRPGDGEEQPRGGRSVTGEHGLRERRRVSWRGAVKSGGGARLLLGPRGGGSGWKC
jgi:hypothetical protein